MDYVRMISDLATEEHTYVERDIDLIPLIAPCNYRINNVEDGLILETVNFQKGLIEENGLNGIFIEDLIMICIDRLEFFQSSNFSCRENACCITKLQEALMWLNKRTSNRKKRGIQDTYRK